MMNGNYFEKKSAGYMTLTYRIILVIMRWFLIPQLEFNASCVFLLFSRRRLYFFVVDADQDQFVFNRMIPFQSSVFKRLLMQVTVSLIISSPVLFIVGYL